jgi:DNA-binding NarL/FixJ family response regulator
MVNIIGEFKSVRTNHHAAPAAGQRNHAEAKFSQGPIKSQTAARGATCASGAARALPKAVTPAEIAEQRLGMAMLKAALDCPRTKNPPKWAHARSLGHEQRQEIARQRRVKLLEYVEEDKFTASEIAERLGVAVTTVRTDAQVLRVKLRCADKKQPSVYQQAIDERRAELLELSRCGITRAEAARKLRVSEATIRRDIYVTKMEWNTL